MSGCHSCMQNSRCSSNKTGDQVITVKQASRQKRKKYYSPSLSKKNDAITFELFYKWNKILARANERLTLGSPVKRDVITGY